MKNQVVINLLRMVENFIINFFHKVKSDEEFIEIVKRKGTDEISLEPNLGTVGWTSSTLTVGKIGTFKYGLKFVAKSSKGRKVVYKKWFFERFGSSNGFADSDERTNASIKIYLFGEDEVSKLSANLPEAKIYLLSPDDLPMDREYYEKLHHDAKVCKVSI